MLKELALWLTTPADRAARRLGHLAEAIALDARSARQHQAWQTHYAQTRQAVLQVAAQCPRTRLALVLGAGSCHDVPVAELAAQFERVLLVDIVQLPAARRLCKRFANVEFIERDLTGVVSTLAAQRGRINAEALAALNLPSAAVLLPPEVLQQDAVDFVASVNVLSQLPVKPVDYLMRQSPMLSLAALNQFSWRLLHAHVAGLRALSVPVCLVTDDRQRTWNANGELVEDVALIETLGLQQRVFARWRWPVAPKGELPAGHHAEHEVVAIQL